MAQTFDEELLERDHELRALRGLVDRAAAESGSVASVEGPAGIGKTRLLREARAIAGAAGLKTASARGNELEREFAFGVVRQLFEPLLSGLARPQRERCFAGAAGLAAPLFEALDAEDLDPHGEVSHAVLHGLYWLTVNLATERPLALLVDDAHWGDAPSLRFLAYLVNRIEHLPVFLAVGRRPFEGAEVDLLDELARSPSTRMIRPGSLSAEAVERLARSELAADVDHSFAKVCFEATDGNPLLLRELLVTLRAEGIAPIASQATRVLEVAPRSVGRSVARRLSRLKPEAGELAQAIAVLGDGADPSLAAELAGLEPGAAAAEAEALRRADILGRDRLEFAHPVVRAAVYAEIAPSERAQRHRAAAGILAEAGVDEDEIALHLLACEPGGDRWVVDVLRRAARRAHSRGAPDVASTYLRRAASEPPPADERVGTLVDLGSAELSANRPGGFDRLREAMELAGEPAARADVALRLGRSLSSWADFPGAAKVFEEALTDLGEPDSDLGRRLEAEMISVCTLDQSLRPRVLDRLLELVADSDGVSDPVLLATLALAKACAFEPAGKGADLAERALADGRLSVEEDPTVVAIASFALVAADRLDQAKRVWDEAIAVERRRGSHYAVGFAWTLRAFVHLRLGAISAAEADARGAFEHAPDLPLHWIVTPLLDVLLERGELDAADRLLAEHEIGCDLPMLPEMLYLLDGMGRLRLAQNRTAEGIAHLRECGRRLELALTRNPGLIPWRSSLAPALATTGEREEALALAREEVELARAFEVPRELGMALRAVGLIEAGDEGIELLRAAADLLEETPARLEHARALTDLGAALRRKGLRAEARGPLRAGLEAAQRSGATALARRAHAELVATGARPRRFVLSGVDALTASERRVSEMAAEGLTNREIAQALFVTEKTVEGHLGHAYQKLDINSRSQLPEALQA